MAKKRYHQTRRDRMHESRGMKKYERKAHHLEDLHDERHARHHGDHKYHQTREDRMHEAEGMRHYYATHKEDVGSYHDPRRRWEYEDSKMLHEDHRAPANLPQHVVHKYYPHGHYGHGMYLDDTIEGIDDQMLDDAKKMHEYLKPEKY